MTKTEKNKLQLEFLLKEGYVINSKFELIFHNGSFDLIFNAYRGIVPTKFVNILNKINEIKVNHVTSSAFISWNIPEWSTNS